MSLKDINRNHKPACKAYYKLKYSGNQKCDCMKPPVQYTLDLNKSNGGIIQESGNVDLQHFLNTRQSLNDNLASCFPVLFLIQTSVSIYKFRARL